MSDTRTIAMRSETFGLESLDPWSLRVLHLVLNTPRCYLPLVESLERNIGGYKKEIDRMTSSGFVAFQDAISYDLRTGAPSGGSPRAVRRFVLTRSGRTLTKNAREDSRVLEDTWPRLESRNTSKLFLLLDTLDLPRAESHLGVSYAVLTSASRLPERSVRFWVSKLCQEGYVRECQHKLSDVREIVPAHWRTTKNLCLQVRDVLTEEPQWAHLYGNWRLARRSFLQDIDPKRVSWTGATDYDHDITAQLILSRAVASERFVKSASFDIEPRYTLHGTDTLTGAFRFDFKGDKEVSYLPDAQFLERLPSNKLRRSVLEYERYQSRKDGWAHLERMCGWVALKRQPFEAVTMRFVVDSRPRLRAYVELIEAFADYLSENPHRSVPNQVTLMASSVQDVLEPGDALEDTRWYRIELPTGQATECLLHDRDKTPYNRYFAGD
jgi:hypothetical protein